MPLSENEEKILADIEANIRRSDPDLAQHVEQTTIYRHSGRRILFSNWIIAFIGSDSDFFY